MNKKIPFIIILIAAFTSCGPSKAEVEAIALRAQAVADSTNAAVQMEAEKQASLKEQLMSLKSQLAGEEAKLESIQEYKLLRTQDEKAQQVADQTLIIEQLKSQIEEINNQMH